MTTKVRELMKAEPITLERDAPVLDAAQRMRESDVGSILVTEKGKLRGIVTDRDLVIRCMAAGEDPRGMHVGDLCTAEPATLSPEDDSTKAVELMKKEAVRRVPVVDGGKAVGILSIGDLAQDRDEDSALARISAAPANQ